MGRLPISFSLVKSIKTRTYIAIMASLIAFTICCISYSWKYGVFFATIFLIEGFVNIQTRSNAISFALSILWGIFSIVTICFASPFGTFPIGGIRIALLNILCCFLITEMVYLLIAKWHLSVTISIFLLVVLTSANTFIYQFRGKELNIMDFLSINTAVTLAEKYDFMIIDILFYIWLIWGVCAMSRFMLPHVEFNPEYNSYKRPIVLVLMLSTILLLIIGAKNVSIKTWGTEGSEVNGYFLNFYLGIRDSVIAPPEDYTLETVTEYADNYATVSDISHADKPNIIVIMNESFCDLSVFPNEVSTNKEITPFLNSLEDNVIRGYALSSIYAGNTANSEFEMLTGHSMAFLPTNSIPYQQYISDKMYSLPWLMNTYGYTTMATHPFYATGWGRTNIYPWFGFKSSSFLDEYPCENLIREYVSDQEMSEYILDKLYNKEDDSPLFLFGVTMQNHGGYTYEGVDYTQSIKLKGYSENYPMAEQYLSLIHETDKAMEYLLTSLEEYPEDTIVLFFGDHLPHIESAFYEELNNGTFDTLDEKMTEYTIPFFIWANYDIDEEYIECTSINYLSMHLLETAGFELPSYYNMLKDIEAVIPAINSIGYYSLEKESFITLEEAEGTEAEMLNMYRTIQYNNIFDHENRNHEFFSQYISDVS